MSGIAVSIFISQIGDKVSIKSLSADDNISKAVERMLCEQAANVIKFTSAAFECADEIAKEAGSNP